MDLKQIEDLNSQLASLCGGTASTEEWATILDHLKEIASIEAQMEALKERRLQLREDAPSLLAMLYMAAESQGDDPHYVASVLYWQAKGGLAAAAIGSPLGLHPSMPNAFMPLIIGKCELCDGNITVGTHSQKETSQRKTICDSCEEAITRSVKIDRTQIQREESQRLQELRTMPYRDYLQTDEWGLKRKEAMRRAGYRCQLCNKQTTLNVHHRTYERRGNERATDLIALCHPCHEIFHQQGKLARE